MRLPIQYCLIARGWLILIALGLILSAGFPPLAWGEESSSEFMTLRVDEANVRVGPGTKYPLLWTYIRRHIPLQVIGRFGDWHQIRDWQGNEGWLHKRMLSHKKTALILDHDGLLVMRRYPTPDAKTVASIENQVFVHILQCQNTWCKIRVADYDGWVERRYLWGA